MSTAGPPAAASRLDPAYAAESNTAQILAVVTVFHVLALTFVSLRVYARAFVIKTFGRDDVCMVLSALCALGGWIVFIIQAQYGLGKHQATISAADMVIFQQAGFWQSVISANCALGLLKISIGFNLLRLSSSKWYSWALWATIGFVCCYTFMGAMTFFLYCTPMAGFWNPALKPQCYSLQLFITFALVNTSFNIFTDVLFASFPIPIIWSLQMKRKLRIYLVGILSLGYFAVAMGVVKAVYQIAFGKQSDKTFRQSVQFWGFLQLNIGIIAACATSLKPLLKRVLKLSTADRYNTPSNYGYGGTNRSRKGKRGGTMLRDGDDAAGGGGGGGDFFFQGSKAVDAYEMDAAGVAERGNLGAANNLKGETYTTATSFYKHGSVDGSGSEEMILATMPPPQQPRHALAAATDEQAAAVAGIVRTTEVYVTVR